MTISANYDAAPEFDTIIRMGLQLAGLVPLGKSASAPQIAHARQFLDAFLKDMKNGCYMLSHQEMATQTLTIGTVAYVLAADTVDVDAPMMLTAPGATTQTELTPVSYDYYMETVDKQTQGLPIIYYVEKLATVTVRFYPVPDKAYVASFRRKRLIRNADSGTTLDATQGWTLGVSYAIAAIMGRCGSMELATINDRQTMADKLLNRAQNREVESVDMTFVLPELR